MTLQGKRILIVSSTLELGGAERQLLNLVKCLKSDGINVKVWGHSKPELAAQRLTEMGIDWKIYPFRYPCRKVNFVRNLLCFFWAYDYGMSFKPRLG